MFFDCSTEEDQVAGGKSSFKVGRGRWTIVYLPRSCGSGPVNLSSLERSCLDSSCLVNSCARLCDSAAAGVDFFATRAGVLEGRVGASFTDSDGSALFSLNSGSRDMGICSTALSPAGGFSQGSRAKRWRTREKIRNGTSGDLGETTTYNNPWLAGSASA